MGNAATWRDVMISVWIKQGLVMMFMIMHLPEGESFWFETAISKCRIIKRLDLNCEFL